MYYSIKIKKKLLQITRDYLREHKGENIFKVLIILILPEMVFIFLIRVINKKHS